MLKTGEQSKQTFNTKINMRESVTRVEYARSGNVPTTPNSIVITAVGQVPTSGWTHGQLVPRFPETPPVDGVYMFDFVATRPSGIVPQVLSFIPAIYLFKETPTDFKKIEVIGRNSSRTAIPCPDM